MRLFLVLLLGLSLGLAAAEATDTTQVASLQKTLIERLRVAGSSDRLQAMQELRALPGFPASAGFAIPALVWIDEDEDPDVRSAARDLLTAMDWPHIPNLNALRAFAAKQDAPYKMMAVKALGRMAEQEPEALLMLLQICRGRFGPVADMAAAQGTVLLHRPCMSPDEADAWSKKAEPLVNDFMLELTRPPRRSRPILALLDSCGGWHPALAVAAREALKQTQLQ